MSHYTVLVIADESTTMEGLLEPFDEELDVEPYVNITRNEIIEKVKKEDAEKLTEMKACKEAERECYCHIWGNGWRSNHHHIPTDEEIAAAEKLVNEFDADNAYARYKHDEWDGTYPLFDAEGNQLSTYNPNSKWDWYSLGGRWGGGLPTKNGENVDVCAVTDIDWSLDEESVAHCERWWEVNMEDSPLREGEDERDFLCFYNKDYIKDTYGSKEGYVKASCTFGTYAVLTPDGEWHEVGPMGWFGVSGASGADRKEFRDGYRELVEQYAKPGYTAYLVDCHI